MYYVSYVIESWKCIENSWSVLNYKHSSCIIFCTSVIHYTENYGQTTYTLLLSYKQDKTLKIMPLIINEKIITIINKGGVCQSITQTLQNRWS